MVGGGGAKIWLKKGKSRRINLNSLYLKNLYLFGKNNEILTNQLGDR